MFQAGKGRTGLVCSCLLLREGGRDSTLCLELVLTPNLQSVSDSSKQLVRHATYDFLSWGIVQNYASQPPSFRRQASREMLARQGIRLLQMNDRKEDEVLYQMSRSNMYLPQNTQRTQRIKRKKVS